MICVYIYIHIHIIISVYTFIYVFICFEISRILDDVYLARSRMESPQLVLESPLLELQNQETPSPKTLRKGQKKSSKPTTNLTQSFSLRPSVGQKQEVSPSFLLQPNGHLELAGFGPGGHLAEPRLAHGSTNTNGC